MENNKEIIHESEVKELIIELRGEKVLIERDVAKLYGLETKRINEAVKNDLEIIYEEIGTLKNEKLKKDFEKLKIWNYLYDVYLEIKKTIEKLDKNIETDAFCTSKKYIEDKYFS